MHKELLKALKHTEQHKDYSLLLRLIQKMPCGVNRLRAVKWIERYSPFIVKFEGKDPKRFDRRGTIYAIEDAVANPYWTLANEEKKDGFGAEFELARNKLQRSFSNFLKSSNDKNHHELLENIDVYIEATKMGIKLKSKSSAPEKTLSAKPRKYIDIGDVKILQGGSPGLGKRR